MGREAALRGPKAPSLTLRGSHFWPRSGPFRDQRSRNEIFAALAAKIGPFALCGGYPGPRSGPQIFLPIWTFLAPNGTYLNVPR